MKKYRNKYYVVSSTETGETLKILNRGTQSLWKFLWDMKKKGCCYHECVFDKFGKLTYNRYVSSKLTIYEYFDR